MTTHTAQPVDTRRDCKPLFLCGQLHRSHVSLQQAMCATCARDPLPLRPFCAYGGACDARHCGRSYLQPLFLSSACLSFSDCFRFPSCVWPALKSVHCASPHSHRPSSLSLSLSLSLSPSAAKACQSGQSMAS